MIGGLTNLLRRRIVDVIVVISKASDAKIVKPIKELNSFWADAFETDTFDAKTEQT